MLSDEIKQAWDSPQVLAARSHLQEVVNEFEGNIFGAMTNYMDQRVIHSLLTRSLMVPNGTQLLTCGDVDRIEAAYAAFCDALAPYQPSAESVRQAFEDAPPVSWAAKPPSKGQIFYFLPSSGGYWVTGKAEMGNMLNSVRDFITTRNIPQPSYR